jgi:2-polyprenyl-6-methoxyphenol hydroxylase-like FAD-dependent oxidoreductase
MPNSTVTTKCCIAGGGPSGMMLSFLLARAGVDVVVLEKHADFFRDFRGDTIHPSTLELMYELGLLDEFLMLPHQKLDRLAVQVGDERVRMIDLTHLSTHCKYIALMPQWDFLNFLAAHGKRYKGFDLRMQADATGLIEEAGASSDCAPGRRTANSRSAPILWSAPTAVIRRCALRPVSKATITARRWTYCGFGCPARRPTRPKRSATSRPAR